MKRNFAFAMVALSWLAVLPSATRAEEQPAPQPEAPAPQDVEWTLSFTEDFNGPGLDGNLWSRIDKGWNDWNRHMYSANVPNLMFAGRDISCTHIGMSSTRVMGTCATLGQAVGTAAALLVKYGIDPAQLRRERIGELQDALEDDDCMLPFRWRKVSLSTREAEVAPEMENLRNGIDRRYGGEDNGLWVEAGDESMVYTWKAPRRLSGARIVFDSEMTHTGKRMRKLEATTERAKMPKMLAKSFRIDVRAGGEWRTVFHDDLNILRFRKVAFAPIDADAMRLVVMETWGGSDLAAHVFALDALP